MPQVDTTNILFICGGAFEGLDKIIRNRSVKGGIGFGAQVVSEEARLKTAKRLQDVEPDDLVKFGLIPEFVGRLPVIATLDELDEAALVSILTEPKNALVKQFQKLFEMEDVELVVEDAALTAMARKAMERRTGARGLRSILEGVLLDTMYELPAMDGVARVVVNSDAITGKAQPLLVSAQDDQPAAA